MRRWLGIGLPIVVGLIMAGLLVIWVPDGTPVTVRLPLAVVPIVIGIVFSAFAVVGVILARRTYRDMAKQLQEQREQFSHDRRRFVQRLDHEFKNPLTALRASITNLKGETTENGRTTALNTMSNQTLRLVRLTTDLRKISELESRPLENDEVDLTALLVEVDEVVREKHVDRQLALSLPRAPWPLPTIIGDWDLLFLAFYNLADNALKFTGQGDTVEIRAREETESVVVEVADTGLGIAESETAHVWEELYRGENGRSVAGSGLGLPLVKAIIERHNGIITLTSRSGQGTNVTVTLPKSTLHRH